MIHKLHKETGSYARIIIGNKEIYPDSRRIEAKKDNELVIQVRYRLLGGTDSLGK